VPEPTASPPNDAGDEAGVLAPAPATVPEPEPRQRWRAVFGRTADAAALAHREVAEALEDALAESPLPLMRDRKRGDRPRVTFGAPLPIGMVVDRELFDLWLTALRPLNEIRAVVGGALAPGYELHDLYDIWLGALALPASVVGATYRVTLEAGIDRAALAAAIEGLLEAASLPRQRVKGSGTVAYDLRPLLADLALLDGDRPSLQIDVRFDPTRGSGRPEEVVAALAEALDRPLEVTETRRTQLVVEDSAG